MRPEGQGDIRGINFLSGLVIIGFQRIRAVESVAPDRLCVPQGPRGSDETCTEAEPAAPAA